MDSGLLFGRSIAFPPRIGADGKLAWSEGETNIRESIRIILETEPGERINLPGFGAGLRKLLFEPNTVATRFEIQDQVAKALAAWEPRISVTDISVEEDPSDSQGAIATIHYRLVATQVQERISMNLKLAG
jgi:uncharacterized protein